MDKSVLEVPASFRSKAAQKDFLNKLNRAYDGVKSTNRQVLENAGITIPDRINEGSDRFSDEWIDFWEKWDTPLDLHQVREKHFSIFAKVKTEEQVQFIRNLISARNEAKQVEIVKPAKKVKPVAKNGATHSGVCQVCGRIQRVNNKTGLLAKHGFVVEWEQHHGECDGSGQLPAQVSTDVTVKRIANLREQSANILEALGDEPKRNTVSNNDAWLHWNNQTWLARELSRSADFLTEAVLPVLGKDLTPADHADI